MILIRYMNIGLDHDVMTFLNNPIEYCFNISYNIPLR